MKTAHITSKSRNLGINATAYATNGPNGYYFAPLDYPAHTGGCATIRKQLADYRRMWSGGTYYRVDMFVGGKRVNHEDGSFENLRDFCQDDGYRERPGEPIRYSRTSITVTLDDPS